MPGLISGLDADERIVSEGVALARGRWFGIVPGSFLICGVAFAF